MLAPVVDGRTGSVSLAPEMFAALVQHALDPARAAAAPGGGDQLDLLSRAHLIERGRAHPRLAGVLAAIVNPSICTLELRQSGKTMEGWVDPDVAALLLPPDSDGRCTLISLHPSLLPEALARLVDLRPRPQALRAEPLRAGTHELARLLEGEPPSPIPPPPQLPPADSLSAPALRRRWHLSTRWSLDDGRPQSAALEAIDSDEGLWLLEGEGERMIAWPTTATTVWRLIVRLVMRRADDTGDPIGSFS